MPTVDQTFIQNKVMEYMETQKKVFTSNLYNQFDGYPPDLVIAAINDLIDTNVLMTKVDEKGKEFIYLGPNR